MQNPPQKDTIAVPPTPEQDEQARHRPASEQDAVRLAAQQLEERIVPRLASNHNETFLVDR